MVLYSKKSVPPKTDLINSPTHDFLKVALGRDLKGLMQRYRLDKNGGFLATECPIKICKSLYLYFLKAPVVIKALHCKYFIREKRLNTPRYFIF